MANPLYTNSYLLTQTPVLSDTISNWKIPYTLPATQYTLNYSLSTPNYSAWNWNMSGTTFTTPQYMATGSLQPTFCSTFTPTFFNFSGITNTWNMFTSGVGNVFQKVKQGVKSAVSTVSNFVKEKARYQAHYTAISDKVKTYGRNSKFIEKLHPAMQEKMMQLLDWAKSNGITLNITSGFRTAADQKKLQCKNKGGKKVAARVGSSPHEYGIAVDFKSSNDAAVGKKAKELGMVWGGDWGSRKGGWSREVWHIDMSNTIEKVYA